MLHASRFPDDRIAVQWPTPIRPIVQAIHYRLARLNVLECFPAAYVAQDTMELWPSYDDVLACKRGSTSEQFGQRTDLCLQLISNSQRRVFNRVLDLQPNSCAVHRVLRLSVDQFLGYPPDAVEARRRLTQMLPLIHADKMAALEGGNRSQVSESLCQQAGACLLTIRDVLNDSRYAHALFVSDRLQYGQFGSRTAGRILAVLCWMGVLLGLRRSSPTWPSPSMHHPSSAAQPPVLTLPSSPSHPVVTRQDV